MPDDSNSRAFDMGSPLLRAVEQAVPPKESDRFNLTREQLKTLWHTEHAELAAAIDKLVQEEIEPHLAGSNFDTPSDIAFDNGVKHALRRLRPRLRALVLGDEHANNHP